MPEERKIFFLKNAPIIFGRYWKTHAALGLKKGKSTITNWRMGRTPVPELVIILMQAYIEQNLFYDASAKSMKLKKNGKSR